MDFSSVLENVGAGRWPWQKAATEMAPALSGNGPGGPLRGGGGRVG